MTRPDLNANSDADSTRPDGTQPPTERDPARLVRGSVLAGKYRLESRLGEGGMAVVWSAYHLELEVPVAIKLLHGHDASLARRLKLEARAAARLVHPAIVRILDVSTTSVGDPFIVMELLTGETLASALARGHISALRAIQLLLPIAEALGLAHEQGVVHRDLKPENVFLALEGEILQPKLLDFGIAKRTDGVVSRRLTASGVALGSPSYMSPEQARGEEVNHLSDVWSFCVLMYKAIGGKAPFRGATPRDVLDAILEQEPPPLPLGAGVDQHLARIVLSGLNKDPTARPLSMRRLGQQLARWLLLHGVAVDACGAQLVSKWLSSDAPTKPRASDAPPPMLAAAPTSDVVSEPEITAPLQRPAPPPSSREPLSVRSRRLPRPRRRHWVLWAVAGVLVAVVSLGLTRGKEPEPRRAAVDIGQTRATEQQASVAASSTEAGEPQLGEPLAASDVEPNAEATPARAVTASSGGRRAAPRQVTPPRAKDSAPNARPALPF